MARAASDPSTTSLVERAGVWPVRAMWAIQPLVSAPVIDDALDERVASFSTGVALLAWLLWGAVLAATLVPHPTTLTAIRIALPAAVVASAWATIVAGDVDALTVVGLATVALAAVAAFTPTTGRLFVDGSSYGDERRMPLRAPGALLLGPVQAAWAVVVAGAATGPLLLLAQRWVAGALALVVGWPLAAAAARALHGLARRWVVFVPAGLVLHDAMALADPVLFARRSITSLGPAPAHSPARDLTLGALGLALELRVDPPVPATFGRLARRAAGDVGDAEATTLDAVLFTPSQPGELLREARRRGIRA